jgi:FtsZ-binding cell division protein ZapB
METNPIESLNLFERLVVEHGSAKVMKPHIDLLKEIITNQEKKNQELSVELEKLTAVQSQLREENEKLKRELATHQCELPEHLAFLELHALLTLGNSPAGLSAAELATKIQKNEAEAFAQIEEFIEWGILTEISRDETGETAFKLNSKGKQYARKVDEKENRA